MRPVVGFAALPERRALDGDEALDGSVVLPFAQITPKRFPGVAGAADPRDQAVVGVGRRVSPRDEVVGLESREARYAVAEAEVAQDAAAVADHNVLAQERLDAPLYLLGVVVSLNAYLGPATKRRFAFQPRAFHFLYHPTGDQRWI